MYFQFSCCEPYLGAPVVAIGLHIEDLEHFLMVLGTIVAGHGTPEGVKWHIYTGGSTDLLESRMPDRRAMESKIPVKSRLNC